MAIGRAVWRPAGAASTERLLQLCAGYYLFYVLTGIFAKTFTGMPGAPLYHRDITYLANNTLGGTLFALAVVFALRWFRLRSNHLMQVGPWRVPSELLYILPSGVCTAVVIPTTTLMYTLPISVMVAMVIMRGSVIVISRAVDAVQIRQGILRKRVYAEENWAVVLALLAVATNVLWTPGVTAALAGLLHRLGVSGVEELVRASAPARASFEFLQSPAALTIMSLYIVAYAIRIYIMNYYKNTRARGVPLDNPGFFAFEQVFASLSMVALGAFFFLSPDLLGLRDPRVLEFREAVTSLSLPAVLSGIPYGAVAFFSVFIFMFQGRTATFAGLVNRLTSLLAGTTATLILALSFGQRLPSLQEWASLLFILIAVYFLTRAERKRVAEGLGTASRPTQLSLEFPARSRISGERG